MNLKMIFDYIVHKKLNFFSKNFDDFLIYYSDTFLVGYPKSGNTWLNWLVACLKVNDPAYIDFTTIESIVADIYFNERSFLNVLEMPRHFKSHEPYTSRYPKVIYIVRDPRAVAISYYHYLIGLQKLSKDVSISDFISVFISGAVDHFGTWGQHVSGWINASRNASDKILVVRYEDLIENIDSIIRIIADFLKLHADDKSLQKIIFWCSPDNMRRIELDSRNKGHKGFANFKENAFFIRNCEAEYWRKEISVFDQERIVNAWSDLMVQLGYDVTIY